MADDALSPDEIAAMFAAQADDAEIVDAEPVAERDASAPLSRDEIAALIAGESGAAEPEQVRDAAAPLSPDEIAALLESEPAAAPVASAIEPLRPAVPEPLVEAVQFADLPPVEAPLDEIADIDLLLDVPLRITVELGQATRTIRELLELGRGSLLNLSRHAGEPVDVLVNGQHIARGEVVVIDENFGVRVTEVVSPEARLRSMAE